VFFRLEQQPGELLHMLFQFFRRKINGPGKVIQRKQPAKRVRMFQEQGVELLRLHLFEFGNPKLAIHPGAVRGVLALLILLPVITFHPVAEIEGQIFDKAADGQRA